tara:strand:- start:2409 stop:3290 length:882 start_codon:yes stop_codon:yes gene_type:complete
MKSVKGIILAGGNGSRLYPLTFGISKQLLPVYDKPMIYYPLSVLMSAGINDILIITQSKDLESYRSLLGDGSKIGIKICFKIQSKPNGIAESLILGKDFISNNDVCLILGDNIFHGKNLIRYIKLAKLNLENGNSSIFGVKVSNPSDFGVVEFDGIGNLVSIKEKPKEPKSNLIVSGIYFYKNNVKEFLPKMKPSKRGELEITDVNNYFLRMKSLKLIQLDSQVSWIDTGTYESLIKASKYFQEVEKKTGKKIGCVEEIAYKMGYINKKKLNKIAKSMKSSDYGKYLSKILER